ncbi:MAG: uncharacterized protein A8A55_1739 [Amphiamblys sp. WSBS2006]|nr:MAG: uncharacterized protein A8A55_1739 [Amphiamblys sp. WSBS2006]
MSSSSTRAEQDKLYRMYVTGIRECELYLKSNPLSEEERRVIEGNLAGLKQKMQLLFETERGGQSRKRGVSEEKEERERRTIEEVAEEMGIAEKIPPEVRDSILAQLDEFVEDSVSFCCLVARKEEGSLKKSMLDLYLRELSILSAEHYEEPDEY